MKLSSLLILALLCSSSCASQKTSDDVTISYNASTRGSNISLEITSKIFRKIENGNEFSTQTSSSLWNELTSLISALKLENIESFEAPSDKRLYDGALHAVLKITVNNKSFISQTFDHGNPPKELKPLLDKLFTSLNIE